MTKTIKELNEARRQKALDVIYNSWSIKSSRTPRPITPSGMMILSMASLALTCQNWYTTRSW